MLLEAGTDYPVALLGVKQMGHHRQHGRTGAGEKKTAAGHFLKRVAREAIRIEFARVAGPRWQAERLRFDRFEQEEARPHTCRQKTAVPNDEEAVGGAPKEGTEETRLTLRWYSQQIPLRSFPNPSVMRVRSSLRAIRNAPLIGIAMNAGYPQPIDDRATAPSSSRHSPGSRPRPRATPSRRC